MDRYEILGEIGSGRSCVVKKAKDRNTGRLVALKVMNKNERSVCRCRKEAEMQALCHAHPSVASVENFVETPEAFVIVQEYADRGDCATAFVSGKLSQPLSVFARVVDSVAYMHAKNIAHLDIKLENILLRKSCVPLLTDFGHATPLNDEASPLLDCACCEQVVEYEQSGAMKPLKGTRAYLAPEAFTVRAPEEFRKLDYRAMDIWALGIVLHVLLLEQFPWDEAQDSPDFPTYQEYISTGNLPLWKELRPELAVLLRGMLCPDPKYRLSVMDVKRYMHRRLAVDFSRPDQVLATETAVAIPGIVRAQSVLSCILIALVASLVLMFGQKCAAALPSMLGAVVARVGRKLLL